MGWEETSTAADGTEWVRADGAATIRLRERDDGTAVVRLDRLEQAPEGSMYRRETAPDREAGRAVVDRWQAEFDTTE